MHRSLRELGIPAEDSFWLYAPGGSEMALFVDSVERKGPRHEELLHEVREGRLAVLHAAGDFSFTSSPLRPTRRLVAAGLEYLERHARVPRIWTNHGDPGDLCNVGGSAPTYQQGDRPDSDAYVLDLLLQAGVAWFWTDHNYSHDFCFEPSTGHARSLVVEEETRSGHRIRCFNRYRGALPKAPDAGTLAWQLREENLAALLESRGVSVIYQHWFIRRGPGGQPRTATLPVLPEEALERLSRLAALRDAGSIHLATLSGILDPGFLEGRTSAG